jgi:aquaporin Z
MTAEPWELAAQPFDVIESTVLAEIGRAGRNYAIEAVGTFCLLWTVGVVVCTANPFAALGIGAVLMAMVYAGGRRAGVHCNPAITLAALLRDWISMRDAAGYWCAQLVAGMWAAIAWRIVVAPDRIEAATVMMLNGRTLVAALAAELSFTFVLSYVVFSCVNSAGYPPNKLANLAIGIAVLVGGVDLAALFGVVFLVSQVITGALAGIAFLAFGSAAR